MLQPRYAGDRGHANHGWLDTFHTFSFASYYDPAEMGWGDLRVINEDRVQPGQGFGMHGHNDMEIITYILAGALQHKDSMGNSAIIRPGEVQRMSAGSGVLHSEFNPSQTEPVHLLQIWIEPNVTGIQPSYEQKLFAPEEKRGKLRLVASSDGREGSVTIHQDAAVYVTLLEPGQTVMHPLASNRRAYVQVTRGTVLIDGQPFQAGDGARIKDQAEIALTGGEESAEVLLFDLK
ncbi:MAG TPA: pirin family protein [Candidatus Competibacteraceae bacterium]|nr:pirin family protein [Candidatus Competibacteraceae bacterium]